jgi:hypothetical protein
MATRSVQSLLEDIRFMSEERHGIVEAVRDLVHKTVDGVSEEVKYGGILFTSGVQFCGVFAYTQHVSVEFRKGADISDVHAHLEGAGKGRRHLKLRSMGEIEDKKLAQYLALALAAAKAG